MEYVTEKLYDPQDVMLKLSVKFNLDFNQIL